MNTWHLPHNIYDRILFRWCPCGHREGTRTAVLLYAQPGLDDFDRRDIYEAGHAENDHGDAPYQFFFGP